MNRREMLEAMGAMLALAGGGLATSGCSQALLSLTGGVDLNALTPAQAIKLLEVVEQKIQSHTLSVAQASKIGSKPKAEGFAMFKDIMSSLWMIGAYSDLPKTLQEDPALKKKYEESLPKTAETIFKVTHMLEKLTPTQVKEVQETLQDKTTNKMMQKWIVSQGQKDGVHTKRMAHLTKLWDPLAWRMEKQNPSILFNEVIQKVDKTARHYGITKEQRRHIAQGTLSISLAPAPTLSKNTKVSPVTSAVCNTTMAAGGITIGAAVLLGLVGGILMAAGSATVLLGAIIGPTLGGTALLVGLIVLIVGASRGW